MTSRFDVRKVANPIERSCYFTLFFKKEIEKSWNEQVLLQYQNLKLVLLKCRANGFKELLLPIDDFKFFRLASLKYSFHLICSSVALVMPVKPNTPATTSILGNKPSSPPTPASLERLCAVCAIGNQLINICHENEAIL